MSQNVNYMDLIRNGGNTGKHTMTMMKNTNFKENIKSIQGIEATSSPLSFSSASPNNHNSKKSKNLESDCLGELDIKQLTNTRHKHRQHKENNYNNNNNNLFLLTKEQQQQQQGIIQNNNTMQNSYLYRKNQQSPLVYNREAERFSYLCDPMISQQLQEQSIKQQMEQQQKSQTQLLRAQQQQYQQMNNQIYTQNLHQPNNQQYFNSKQTMLSSYPQQNHQYISTDYNRPNWNSYTTPYNNLQYQTNIPYQTQFQNHQYQYQQKQQQQQLIQHRSLNSSYSKEQSLKQEDSFGNTKSTNLQTPNIPDQASVLQRYNSKPIIVSSEPIKKTSTRLLLPRINSSTVIFIILAAYVVFKNLSKITGAVETINTFFHGTRTTKNSNEKRQDIPLITGLRNSQQQNSDEQGQQGIQYQELDGNKLSEQNKQEKQDAAIARTFARELIKELFNQLKQKGRVYRSDYEDQLSHRFSIHMLREILPEVVKDKY